MSNGTTATERTVDGFLIFFRPPRRNIPCAARSEDGAFMADMHIDDSNAPLRFRRRQIRARTKNAGHKHFVLARIDILCWK